MVTNPYRQPLQDILMTFQLIPAAYAQEAGGTPPAIVSSLLQFAPLVGIFLVFYMLLIRPEQQKRKKIAASLAAIKRGDRVVTGGGIVATVQKTRDKEVELEIAPNVRVTVMRDTISSVFKPTPANDSGK
jgi:preprotein translocase subunit YajC